MSQHEELKKLLMEATCYGLQARTEEKSAYECSTEYLLDHGVRVCTCSLVPVYSPDELSKKYGKKEEP